MAEERKNEGVERYPAVDQHDAVERTGRTEQVKGEDARSFAAGPKETTEGSEKMKDKDIPASKNEGWLGVEGDREE